jgi:hypothetical protein
MWLKSFDTGNFFDINNEWQFLGTRTTGRARPLIKKSPILRLQSCIFQKSRHWGGTLSYTEIS